MALICFFLFKDLELGQKLGDGSFGVVLKGQWKTPIGSVIPVAVKVLKQDALSLPSILQDFVKGKLSYYSIKNLIYYF